MNRQVKKDIGNIQLQKETLVDRLNKVWAPVITEIRTLLNAISGNIDKTVAVTNYITANQSVLLVDASVADAIVYLPNPKNTKREITIKKIDTTFNNVFVYPINVPPLTTPTIDDAVNLVFNIPYQSVTLITDGINWYLI